MTPTKYTQLLKYLLLLITVILLSGCSANDPIPGDIHVDGDVYADNIHSRLVFSENATIPTDNITPAAWLPVTLQDGTTAYIGAYK